MMRLAPLIAAALAALPAFAAEEVVRIETEAGTVVGTLNVATEAPGPVVLMLHGFTGSRDELAVAGTEDGVFSRTARALAEAGYSSLRIDFRGSGDSDGAWEDTTFTGQTADALAALDWLAGEPRVDSGRLAVLGWSQGGMIAAETAARAGETVDALILWAPVTHPRANYAGIVGEETMTAALAAEPATLLDVPLPWWEDMQMRAGFFHEAVLASPVAAVASYDGPVQVIVGLRDTTIAPQPASGEAMLAYHDGPHALVAFDTDHVWDAFAGPQTLDDQMIPATLDWLAAHLPDG